ncbi:carboxypeptidase-like regulatory domain-containing protein [Pedobacter paludis]|uniref:Carboxypeptidase-like regulatory domain-containing protein n=1 Tax=Pedobacter paludis TaxID=2203212 RepID=A0A317EUW5_9SPHI|nr:carboxypeptidase-like regulatory domain-containing protein [Pedobacter paludis]PWS30731.1 hypothetical protein DF947_17555 [Pedobacter paludis]
MRIFFSLFILFTLCAESFAQQSFNLSGYVRDKKGEVLPGTGIYVSGYKIATATNNDGSYILNLKQGNYDILVQLIGFKAVNKNIVITDKSVKLDFVLEESVTQLAEVTIKPDPNRENYINLFKSYFIGTTPNAESCKILNPQVLRIDYNKEAGLLNVKTDEFLIIENKALGYKIKYLINDFLYDYNSRIIYYEGYPTYEDLPGSSGKKKKWAEKRLEAYNGSAQHFFTSLFNNNSFEEGFVINKLIRKPNPERPPDSTIRANIKRLTQAQTGIKGTLRINLHGQDSLSYWIAKKNLPQGISILSRAQISPDTLVHQFNQNIKSINFSDVLYVIYTKEREHDAFANRIGQSIARPLDMPNYQVSLINLSIRPVYFYKNGSVYNTKSMLYEGYWAWEKVADSVPMDYVPPPR